MSRVVKRKEHPLSMRLPVADISIIDRAATLRGRSRTEFVRDAAVRAAEDVLMETAPVRMEFPPDQGFHDGVIRTGHRSPRRSLNSFVIRRHGKRTPLQARCSPVRMEEHALKNEKARAKIGNSRFGGLSPEPLTVAHDLHSVLLWQGVSRSLAQNASSVQPGKRVHGRPCRARSQSSDRLLWSRANGSCAINIAAVYPDRPATQSCSVPDVGAACDGPELDREGNLLRACSSMHCSGASPPQI